MGARPRRRRHLPRDSTQIGEDLNPSGTRSATNARIYNETRLRKKLQKLYDYMPTKTRRQSTNNQVWLKRLSFMCNLRHHTTVKQTLCAYSHRKVFSFTEFIRDQNPRYYNGGMLTDQFCFAGFAVEPQNMANSFDGIRALRQRFDATGADRMIFIYINLNAHVFTVLGSLPKGRMFDIHAIITRFDDTRRFIFAGGPGSPDFLDSHLQRLPMLRLDYRT